jgi:hypothetical protein
LPKTFCQEQLLGGSNHGHGMSYSFISEFRELIVQPRYILVVVAH